MADMILYKTFDDIVLRVVGVDIFRQLVLSRLVYPVSKLKTGNCLDKYHELNYPVQ